MDDFIDTKTVDDESEDSNTQSSESGVNSSEMSQMIMKKSSIREQKRYSKLIMEREIKD